MSITKSELTDLQKRRLENIQYGLKRNHLTNKNLASVIKEYDYSTINNWVNGRAISRKTDEKLDILEQAYAKCLGLDVTVSRNGVSKETTETFMLDTAKLKQAMAELELNFAQVLALSKAELPDEVVVQEQNAEISKKAMKKLEKLFDKPKQYFVYVEPEPVASEVEPQETAEPNSEMEYQLTKCQEELASIKADVAEMKEKWLNLVKLFNDVEDSNAAIYKLVKEMHYDLIGGYQEEAMHEATNQAGV